MRTGKVVVVVALLALASGCGADKADGNGVATAQSGATTAPSASSATAEKDEDRPLKFAQCMRKNGMTWFPDPSADGHLTVKTPKGLDPKKFEEATKACREFAPDGGDMAEPNPEMVELGRQMAKCMRENGVPDFPDPQPNGSIRLDRDKTQSGPGDPAFDKAEEKCRQFMPDRGQSDVKGGGISGGSGASA